MGKAFVKSYRLGAAAGMLSGFIYAAGIWPAYYLLFPEEFANMASTSFLLHTSMLLACVFIGMLFGLLFVGLINVLPTKNIITKALLLATVLVLVIELPIHFLAYGLGHISTGWTSHLFDILCDIILIPLLFALCYAALAKGCRWITHGSKALFGVLLAAVYLCFFGVLVATSIIMVVTNVKETASMDTAAMELRIFDAVNQQRALNGLEPLVWDERIHKTSNDFSTRMLAAGEFSHKGLDGDTLDDRLKADGLFFWVANENIYWSSPQQLSSQQVVDDWMNSPGHRSLIVDKDDTYTNGAVGVACNPNDCFVTLDVAMTALSSTFTLEGLEYRYAGLNSPSLGLGDTYPVAISITSDVPLSVYLFDDIAAMTSFEEDGIGTQSSWSKKGVTDLMLRTQATKDRQVVLLNEDALTATTTVSLVYN